MKKILTAIIAVLAFATPVLAYMDGAIHTHANWVQKGVASAYILAIVYMVIDCTLLRKK